MAAKKSSQAKESDNAKAARLQKILILLKGAYPDARVGLNFENAFELLIATMLSAQCTDERVNQVCEELFKRFTSPSDFVAAPLEEIEQAIFSTGFYRNKAKNIKACCETLLIRYQGQIPRTLDELVNLPGVGRKTANCVLSNCYNIPGITVDTHVIRISKLLGLVKITDPVKIEFALMELMPKTSWNEFDLLIITHGRRTCKARKPNCAECAISKLCPSAFTFA
ncbi:MAG: endonuclease III [Ignavibacteria bacterium]|nr:endonuclease III [Ignavibacteria bacterium]